jgi:hypothetical protein
MSQAFLEQCIHVIAKCRAATLKIILADIVIRAEMLSIVE